MIICCFLSRIRDRLRSRNDQHVPSDPTPTLGELVHLPSESASQHRFGQHCVQQPWVTSSLSQLGEGERLFILHNCNIMTIKRLMILSRLPANSNGRQLSERIQLVVVKRRMHYSGATQFVVKGKPRYNIVYKGHLLDMVIHCRLVF